MQDNIEQFSKTMQAQADMRIESRNLEKFNASFKSFTNIVFPTPFLASQQVLVETFEEGMPILQFVASQEHDPKLKKLLAKLGVNLFLKMALVDNFVHADLHPGNMNVRIVNQNQAQMVVVDAGLVSRLSEQDRVNFVDLFTALVERNGTKAATLMVERARYKPEDPKQIEAFIAEMKELIDSVMGQSLHQVEVGRVLGTVLRLGRQYQVPIEPNFTTLFVGTIVLEGLGKQLDPNLNFIDAAAPLLIRNRGLIQEYLKAQLNALFK